MKKLKIFYVALGLIIFCHSQGFAQDNFWENIKVRKSFESKTTDDDKPAIISLTWPKEKENSFLINAGVGYEFNQSGPAGLNSLTGFFLFNRNNLTSKIQHNYKIGLSGSHLIKSGSLSFLGTSAVQIMKNRVDSTHSAIVTSYWHPNYKACLVPIGGYRPSNGIAEMFVLPQAGVEYQGVFDSKGSSQKGYDARAMLSIGGKLAFKKKAYRDRKQVIADTLEYLRQNAKWMNRSVKETTDSLDRIFPVGYKQVIQRKYWPRLLEFAVNYAWRTAVLSNHSTFSKNNPLFTAGVDLYPFPTEDFSIGLSYNNGANPIDGTLKQTFYLLSFQFKK